MWLFSLPNKFGYLVPHDSSHLTSLKHCHHICRSQQLTLEQKYYYFRKLWPKLRWQHLSSNQLEKTLKITYVLCHIKQLCSICKWNGFVNFYLTSIVCCLLRISELLFSGPYNINQTGSGAGQFSLSWTPSEDENGESHPICFVVQAVHKSVSFPLSINLEKICCTTVEILKTTSYWQDAKSGVHVQIV